MKRVIAGLCLALAAGAVRAETLDLDFSSRAVHGAFDGALTNIFPRLTGIYEIGGLVGEVDTTNYRQGHIGFLATGDAGAQQANITAGLGARIGLLDTEVFSGKVTGGELALGGMIEARLPSFNRIGVRAYLYGSPKPSSFGDLEGYFEYAVDGDYQVLRNASVYLGFHQLTVDVQDVGTVTVDTGWHLGLRLNF